MSFDPHQDLVASEIEAELTRRYGEPTRRLRCIQNWMAREGLGRVVPKENGKPQRVATWAELEAFAKAKGYRLDEKGNRAGGGKARHADVVGGQQVLGLEDPAVAQAVEQQYEQEVQKRLAAMLSAMNVPLEQQLLAVRADLHRFIESARGGGINLEDLPDGVKKLGSELRMLDEHIAKLRQREREWISEREAFAEIDGILEVLLSMLAQMPDEVATQVRLQLSKVDSRDEEQRDRAVAEGARVASEKVRAAIAEAVEKKEALGTRHRALGEAA